MDQDKITRTLFLGFVRIHILYHCSSRPWFGQELREELREHGYGFSFGTLYPILHSLEREGLLAMKRTLEGGRWRKFYRTTPEGIDALAIARERARELAKELEEANGKD